MHFSDSLESMNGLSASVPQGAGWAGSAAYGGLERSISAPEVHLGVKKSHFTGGRIEAPLAWDHTVETCTCEAIMGECIGTPSYYKG